MQPESPSFSSSQFSERPSSKPPRLVFEDSTESNRRAVFAFSPNRDTLGGTAYLIVETAGNILIDCPAWDPGTQEFLRAQGGVRWLVITHRGGLGKVREIQQALNCEVVIQEQEAYLLPELTLTSFQNELILTPQTRLLWTSGHSPGSSCVYHSTRGGILFSGRHLLPDRAGNPVPLRTAKTFHWKRQIRHVQRLLDEFSEDTLHWICPGANTGFLRGKSAIDDAYRKLAQLDLDACLKMQPIL